MKKYVNPIIPTENTGRTADPFVAYYGEKYYHCYTCGEGVCIAEAEELWSIGSGKVKTVYPYSADGAKKHWYAPELHRIGGAWYIYGAPLCDEKTGRHTMCVLENKSDDPMGEYIFKGEIGGLENKWNIDGTVAEINGENYFIWTICKEMYMAKMSSPLAVTGEIITLCRPEKPFELISDTVNEGPAVLKHGDKVHIIYSANDSKCDDYCLGILTYKGGEVLNAASWEKGDDAVFKKTDKIFGPGHCSFTKVSEDGRLKDYIVYHANLQSGSGWNGRSVWIKEFTWDDKDYPVFGSPEF